MPGVQGGASAHAGWTVVRHECSSHRFLDPSYLHPICHNFTLQHDRLQSVTTTATKQKIQGELRRIRRMRTSPYRVSPKFATRKQRQAIEKIRHMGGAPCTSC